MYVRFFSDFFLYLTRQVFLCKYLGLYLGIASIVREQPAVEKGRSKRRVFCFYRRHERPLGLYLMKFQVLRAGFMQAFFGAS